MLQIQNEAVKALLLTGHFGLEKESLRIEPEGFLAQTPCNFADDVHIVRDFSENQVEVNTPPVDSPEEAVASLEHYNTIVQQTLHNLRDREYLWPFSNPPYIRSERDIPIAQYTGDEAGKTEYREYLSDRYGRYKMAFSGIHLNYSFSDELLQANWEASVALAQESGVEPPSFDELRDQLYVTLAKRSVAYGWILTAITAASPVMDSSFVEKGKIGGELFQGLATVRCSELGYWNFFAPILRYDSAAAYADSIQEYIDLGLIKYPSELYYPIRLKPRGAYGLEALKDGISHIELRMIDLNPLVRAGIDVRDVRFCQLFLVWLASTPDEPLSVKDQVQAVQNFKNAAHYDLKTVKVVTPDGEAFSVVKAAKRVIDWMEEFYQTMNVGPEVFECLAFEREKFENPECRYAWKIRQEYGEGFVARGVELARKRQREYCPDGDRVAEAERL